MKAYPTVRTAWAAMMRGEIDFLYEVGPEARRVHRRRSRRSMCFRFCETMLYGVILNSSATEFSDARVRRALNYAVDRQVIVEQAFRGHGRQPTAARHGRSTGHSTQASQPITYDPVASVSTAGSAACRLSQRSVEGRQPISFHVPIPGKLRAVGAPRPARSARSRADRRRHATRNVVSERIQPAHRHWRLRRRADRIRRRQQPSRPYFFWHSQSKPNTLGIQEPGSG